MKRYVHIVVMLLVLLPMCSTALSAQDARARKASEALLIDAVSDFEGMKWDSAKDRLAVIVDSDPDNDAAYYYLGLCEFYLGNAKAAEAALKEAVRLDSSNYWYRERLAGVYSSTGQLDKTIDIYESLLADHPKDLELQYRLVNLYGSCNRLDDMMKTLDSIEALAGKDETTTTARYDLLMHMNKPQEAFKVLEDFNEEYSSVQILSMMADFKMAEGADSLALGYYDEVLSYEPDYMPAVLGKAEVFRYRRSYGEFFDTIGSFIGSPEINPESKSRYFSTLFQHSDPYFFKTCEPALDSLIDVCMTMHPKDTSVLALAGSYYYGTDRKDRAMDIFKHTCEVLPGDLTARVTYLECLNYAGDWTTLRDEARKSFEDFPEEPGLLQMSSMASYNLEDYQGVIDDNLLMLSKFAKDTAVTLSAFSSIGDMYHLLGDSKQAYKYYKKALKISPAYVPVLNNYAYYLSVEGRKLGKAYAMSKITVEQEPDNPTYLDTFGWILYLQGKAVEAKPFFKHAMLYGGKDSAVVLDHYAEVLYALKEYDLAKVYWDMAVKKDVEGELPGLKEKIEARMKAIGK